ncbi:MAG: hypothetical protein K2K38_06105 [Clostridia bacterium]|nr:hypothetical protein [Clostridia bacterium]
MKLKKFLLILLAAVSCVCLGFAFGCKDEVEEYTVSFGLSEHVKYVIDGEEKEEHQMVVTKETVVSFSVVVEEGCLPETLVVKAGGETLPATDGVYSYRVMQDVTISATVSEDLLEGEGTQEKPYLVSSLKDLRFVADMVNSGYVNYITGQYQLENDIDCGGAQLDVIGHFENPSAFFAGIFDGKNHTISNYTISTNGKTYVGLFGCVQISTSTTTVMIQNLNLRNFTINATATDDGSVCVGAVAAFTAGANVVACSAEGNINVYGSGYFSYVGGAVGIQQSLSITAADNLLYHYHGTTEYVRTKVMIVADNGYILSAGGVVGQALSSHERGASMIMNSYSEGNIFGAMRSGGVVGTLSDYSSVANCYATGFVSATVTFPAQVNDVDYYAYAGGITGYAGVETTITDSFTTCTLIAESINTGNATGDFYAYASPKTEFVNTVTVFNCYAGNDAKPTNANFIKNTLGWHETDWVINDGAYPSTNLTQGNIDFRITLDYSGKTVDGDELKKSYISIKDSGYFAFSSYLGDTIDEIIVADDDMHASYGLFFDEECTKKVHYSFIPTRDITLYVGFADYSEVAGTYEFKEKDRTVKLILKTDATYSYVDVRSFEGSYVYDGKTHIITFNDAMFARLSSNTVLSEDNTPQPWLNYQPYRFVGTGSVSEGKLFLYDGTYFTNDGEDNLLVFNLAGAQSNVNVFKGTWERSATINEVYEFNSNMTWTYTWKGQTPKSGSYTVNGKNANLTGGITATARIDDNGLLHITETGKTEKDFRLINSYRGNWYSSENGDYLVLDGCGTEKAGSANAIIDGTVYDNLAYVKDGFFDAWKPGNDYVYTIISGYSLFGYFYYDVTTNTITANLYDEGNSGWLEFNFVLLDYYLGDWIGEEKVDDVPFTIMNFNGLGLYKAEGNAKLGYLVINGTKVAYDCSVDTGLDIEFSYEGKDYILSTNGDGTVTVTAKEGGSSSANLYRKDVMASTPLVDDDNNIYEFDGRGSLSKGGKLTITSKDGEKVGEYTYKIISGSIEGRLNEAGKVVEGYDILIKLYKDSVEVGYITIGDHYPKFFISITEKDEDGEETLTEKNLDLYLPFAGRPWSISGLMNSFIIGKFDLTYTTTGTYNGTNNVPFVYYPQYNYIYIFYGNQFDGYVRNYLLLLDDGNMIVSSYPYFVSSDLWYYASPSDEFVGKWDNTVTGAVLEFDGLADSKYAVGVAFDSTNGITYLYTRRFGTLYMWRADDESVAYTVTYYPYDDERLGENVYSKEGIRFGRIELTPTDVLSKPIFTATDESGTKYEFNFDGTVKVGEQSGTYLLSVVDGDKTTVEITIDKKVTTVEVDHNGKTVKVTD